jgi:NADH dehydrogenase FAD-containing subunit
VTHDRFDAARRRFVLQTGMAAAGLLLPRAGRAAGKRVVVLGGGFAGAKVAGTLADLLPDARVRLVERNGSFVPGPLVLPYLLGDAPIAAVRQGYGALAGRGIELVRAEVRGIDTARREVATDAGRIGYDVLVVATGMRYVAGPGENVASECVSPFDRDNLEALKARLRDFRGGDVVVAISSASTLCPPAPYEFALLLAEHMRRQRLGGRITLLESGPAPRPAPLADLIAAELKRHPDFIEYVASAGDVASVDPSRRLVRTADGEEARYDLVVLFPDGAVAPWVPDLDSNMAGDVYVGVDPLTMRSTRHANVYALGDVARVPYGKSAYAADVCAVRCAHAIAADLGATRDALERAVSVACFPYVRGDAALAMHVDYEVTGAPGTLKVTSRARVAAPAATGIAARRAWERRTLSATFGASAATAFAD